MVYEVLPVIHYPYLILSKFYWAIVLYGFRTGVIRFDNCSMLPKGEIIS